MVRHLLASTHKPVSFTLGMFPEGFDSDLLQAVLVSLIDILVVAYVFYRVLLVIRGTRAQQVLVGLAFWWSASSLVGPRAHDADVDLR